jgi:cytosine/adenosine deaminase-related metal-dependent hydrolase/SAM-dependent methyltransferase
VNDVASTSPKHGEPVLLNPAEGYSLWSRVYDSQPNPMIALEERYLGSLIPDLRGRVVVDAGCGSGRWLERLADRGADRMVGIDSSPEMLACAAARQTRAELFLGSCERLPLGGSVADFVLSSFVIGYLSSLSQFAAELRRVLVPGGRVLISDLHPATALRYDWRRSFSTRQGKFAVESRFWPVEAVVNSLKSEGFRLVTHIDPCFAEPEFELFEATGKAETFRALAGQPAIAILAFEAGGTTMYASSGTGSEFHGAAIARSRRANPPLLFRRARVALSAFEAVAQDLSTDGMHITESSWTFPETVDLDLSGYLLLPGLINAHDHLEFGLFPRLGSHQYQNFREWAEEIYLPSESPLRDHLSVPKATRLWWGGLRNLLAGVTTVCHHNPFLPEVFTDEDFPVDVVRDFGWAHSLALDPNVAGRFASTPPEQPFVIHLAEGVDPASANEVKQLDAMCRISARTVLVHGVALTPEGRALLRRRGAALVWCPSSNIFLFGTTLSLEELAEVGRVALGTDSPLTAAGDLLDELRLVRNRGASPAQLYDLVTCGGADVLRLREGQGSLLPSSVANIVALRDLNLSPAESLTNTSFRDVGLVMRRGRVQLVSDELLPRLPTELVAGLRPLTVHDHLCWVRAPLGRLFHDAVEALGCDLRLGGKEVRNVSAEFL